MLYGDIEMQEKLLAEIKRFESEEYAKVIFASTLGSISKGVERIDSDYDIVCLFLKRDDDGYKRFNVLNRPKEEVVHKRKYPTGGETFYEYIVFWEATTFFSFLDSPIINARDEDYLHYLVGWSFFSPFSWDPYGLKGKIGCLLDLLFDVKKESAFYSRMIEENFIKKETLLRDYLYSAYYAIKINYCVRQNRFAPVYFPSLLAMEENVSYRNALLELTELYYQKSREYVCEHMDEFKKKMSNSIVARRVNVIDEYMRASMSCAAKCTASFMPKPQRKYLMDALMEMLFSSLNLNARPLFSY